MSCNVYFNNRLANVFINDSPKNFSKVIVIAKEKQHRNDWQLTRKFLFTALVIDLTVKEILVNRVIFCGCFQISRLRLRARCVMIKLNYLLESVGCGVLEDDVKTFVIRWIHLCQRIFRHHNDVSLWGNIRIGLNSLSIHRHSYNSALKLFRKFFPKFNAVMTREETAVASFTVISGGLG